VAGFRASFVLVAVFFALFSAPTLLLLRDRPAHVILLTPWELSVGGLPAGGDDALPPPPPSPDALYVLAYVCFFGGVNTVIKFSGLFATRPSTSPPPSSSPSSS
jgi:hypothetical protein